MIDINGCECACAHTALIISIPGAQILVSECQSSLQVIRKWVDFKAEKAKGESGTPYCAKKLGSIQRMMEL